MEKESKRRIRITITGIIGLILLVAGISFAAFNTELIGTQNQTMNVGCLKVDMADEGSINVENAIPETDESGLTQTPYVYTITNSCTADAYYEATINVMNTSTLANRNKVKVALDGDSYLAPTIISSLPTTELLDDEITGVSYTYKLDEGYLKAGDTKTFKLRTWIDYDVSSISGKLESKVIINSTANNTGINYNKNTAGYYVVSKNTKLSGLNYSLTAPSEGQTSGVVEKNKGFDNTTYHFRGNPNNYLTFGNANIAETISYTNSAGTAVERSYEIGDELYWRVLSTNTDGSINIILEDVIGETTFANAETLLNQFYNNHLTDEEEYIDTAKQFCIEKASDSGVYLAPIRVENHNPVNKCTSSTNFTKIGLATVDDLMFAGGVYDTGNTDFYLYGDVNSFMVSSHSNASGIYSSSGVKSIEYLSYSTKSAIKPVITLKSNTKLEGEGTEANPFYLSGSYSSIIANTSSKDTIAPTVKYARVDAQWSNENKKIEIAAHDNTTGSGISAYMIKDDAGVPDANDEGWEISSSSKYRSVSAYDNGTYYVFARDNSGNVSAAKKLIIDKVDKEAPTCTVRITPITDYTSYKTLAIVSEEPNLDLHGFSWDDTEIIEDVRKVDINMLYTAHIKDLAGNTGTCSGLVTNIYGEAPTVRIVSQPTEVLESVPVDLSLESTSATIEKWCFSTSNDSANCTWTDISVPAPEVAVSKTITENGTYYAYAMDSTGQISIPTPIIINNVGTEVTSISVTSTTPIWILNTTAKTATATATVSPTNALIKDVTWSSSNTSVAKVSSNGTITPVAAGSVTITATAKDGSGVLGSTTVKVNKATAPTTSFSRATTGGTKYGTITLTSHALSATNGSDTVTVTINGKFSTTAGTYLNTGTCASHSRWGCLTTNTSAPTGSTNIPVTSCNTLLRLIKSKSYKWTTAGSAFCGATTYSTSTAGTYYFMLGGGVTTTCTVCNASSSQDFSTSTSGSNHVNVKFTTASLTLSKG